MPHWKKRVVNDPKHLHYYDIEDVSPLEVVIEGDEDDTVFNNGEEATMMFVRFKGGKKSLGINVTNGTIIEAVTGEDDPAKWEGHKITLRRALCRDEECIRVDAPAGMRLPGSCPKFSYIDAKQKGSK